LVEKEKILSRVSRQLATDGGYLILGSAETIFSDEKWQKRNATRGYYFQYHD
jgi:chemotaxis methyl-accepting protein methylase